MRIILNWLGSLRRSPAKPEPLQLHKCEWHPLFYKAVKVHMLETTAKKGGWDWG